MNIEIKEGTVSDTISTIASYIGGAIGLLLLGAILGTITTFCYYIIPTL